jgi:3-deoxy-manno-octulosonate cytidylyltransferase (CMP-KDO synthetase)
MKICVAIPARFNSFRLPGKPLLKINKKEILLRTYEGAKKIFKDEDIYIFTDEQLVKKKLNKKISNIIVSKKKFTNGTERIAASIKKIKKKYKAILIIACDNSFIKKNSISKVIKVFNEIKKNNNYIGATIHKKSNGTKLFKDKSVAKVVLNKKNDIMYISRSAIPHKLIKNKFFYTHHGIVLIKTIFLKKYLKLKNSPLQIAEDNEWLKFIEYGYKIKSSIVNDISLEINTSNDLRFYRSKYKK